MFDRAFFSHPDFADRLTAFALDHGEHPAVRLIITSTTGDRFDVAKIKSRDEGMTLFTRDDHMIFLPYHGIANIDVSIMADRGTLGFQAEAG